MPLTGTVLWYKNRPSDHGNHLHVEPPTRMVGVPPTSNPGMTDGVRRIYDALETEFGSGAYFTQTTSATKWTHMGGWNRRRIAGSSTWSQHSWWNALDIGPYYDADQDPFYEFLTTYDDLGGPPVFLPLKRAHADERKSDVAAVAFLLNAAYGLSLPGDGSWPNAMSAALRDRLGEDGSFVTGKMYAELLIEVARVQGGGGGVPSHSHNLPDHSHTGTVRVS